MARGLEQRPEVEPARHCARAPSAPAASPVALLLSGVGNQARVGFAAALAARSQSGRILQRQGWSDAREGGWNEGVRKIGSTWRIPVEGIGRGNQAPGVAIPTRKDPVVDTPESAAGRAILLVPPTAKLADGVEVLLQFHGHDVGYRERTGKSRFGVDPGTVRDVEEDLLPQQLEASKRSMIAILPQGTRSSGFAITDPAGYVDEVLALTVPILNAVDRSLKLKKVGVRRIVVSGHSGGGPQTVGAARALEPAKATQEQWLRSPPMLLFDALNGLGEVGVAAAMVERWLDADLAILTAAGAGAPGLLAQRGLKLRSTYSNSDLYSATNIGGTYKGMVPETTTETIDGKAVTKTKKVETTITIAPGASLKGRIDAWFRKTPQPARGPGQARATEDRSGGEDPNRDPVGSVPGRFRRRQSRLHAGERAQGHRRRADGHGHARADRPGSRCPRRADRRQPRHDPGTARPACSPDAAGALASPRGADVVRVEMRLPAEGTPGRIVQSPRA